MKNKKLILIFAICMALVGVGCGSNTSTFEENVSKEDIMENVNENQKPDLPMEESNETEVVQEIKEQEIDSENEKLQGSEEAIVEEPTDDQKTIEEQQTAVEENVEKEQEKTDNGGFTWYDEVTPNQHPMIVSNPTKLYSEPREDSDILGDLIPEQTGVTLAYSYDKEGGTHLGWNKVEFNGMVGYASLNEISYDVPMED